MMTNTPSAHLPLLLLVFALLFFTSSFTLAQFPIPAPSYSGFPLGRLSNDRPQVTFEVFIDPACIDTRDFFRDTFPQLYDTYFNDSVAADSRVVGRVHFMPLPYHIASFEQTKASLWIHSKYPDRYVPFLIANFRNFDHVANPVTQHMTLLEVRRQIFEYAVMPAGITDYRAYSEAMERRDLWEKARTTFKYAVSRGPFGTPSFYVNVCVQLLCEIEIEVVID